MPSIDACVTSPADGLTVWLCCCCADWARRKEVYLSTHNAVPKQLDVTVTSVLFANRLLRRRREALAAPGDAAPEVDGHSANSTDADAEAAQRPRRSSHGEKSWSQQRKDAYLRKYGRPREKDVADADVAVTAVVFASRLMRRSQGGAPASAGGASAGAPVDVA